MPAGLESAAGRGARAPPALRPVRSQVAEDLGGDRGLTQHSSALKDAVERAAQNPAEDVARELGTRPDSLVGRGQQGAAAAALADYQLCCGELPDDCAPASAYSGGPGSGSGAVEAVRGAARNPSSPTWASMLSRLGLRQSPRRACSSTAFERRGARRSKPDRSCSG